MGCLAMRPLRIAFVDYVVDPTRPGRSGLSDIVWDMAGVLVRKGHTAYVVGSYAVKQYPEDGVRVIDLDLPSWIYRNFLTQFLLLWRAFRELAKLRPDVVHTPEYVSSAFLSVVLPDIPVVLTVPGNIYHRLSVADGHSYEWWYAQFLKLTARVSAKRCARVVAISRDMRDWWIRIGAHPNRTPWIPLGADPRRFHRDPDARRTLGVQTQGTLLVFVGRLAREKGIRDLLTAAITAKSTLRQSGAQIVLVGRGPLEPEVRGVIEANDLGEVIRMVPWVPQEDVHLWYSAADAVLLPSRTEGMSRTIPEAFLCGSPIIGTAITGTVDHVVPGITGLLVPVGDAALLAEVLEHVARDATALGQMRCRSQAYACNHLSWQTVVERVIQEVYVPLTSEGRKRR